MRLVCLAAVIAALANPSSAAAQASVPTWYATFDWRSEGPVGERLPAPILAATVGSGDTLYESLMFERRIAVLDQNGKVVRLIGSSGQFKRVSSLGLVGDSLWICDEALRQFTILPNNGGRALTRPFGGLPGLPASPIAGDTVGSRVRPIALLEHGRMLVTIDLPLARAQTPFAYRDLSAVDPNGRRVVAVRLPDPAGQRGTRQLAVTAWSANGEVAFDRTIAFEAQPITQADVDEMAKSFVFSRGGAAHGSVLDEAKRALATAAPRGSLWPPVTRVMVGTDSSVWLT
jgi:hypothetical protein